MSSQQHIGSRTWSVTHDCVTTTVCTSVPQHHNTASSPIKWWVTATTSTCMKWRWNQDISRCSLKEYLSRWRWDLESDENWEIPKIKRKILWQWCCSRDWSHWGLDRSRVLTVCRMHFTFLRMYRMNMGEIGRHLLIFILFCRGIVWMIPPFIIFTFISILIVGDDDDSDEVDTHSTLYSYVCSWVMWQW